MLLLKQEIDEFIYLEKAEVIKTDTAQILYYHSSTYSMWKKCRMFYFLNSLFHYGGLIC